MGRVFSAVHIEIGNPVAIKVLHPYFSQDPGVARRLFQEARAANLVRHPGIVRILDHGQRDDGAPYLIMEQLDGESLSQRLLRPRGDLRDDLRLYCQIAAVLATVHEKGIVHRDLKPENVMIVADPEVPGGERIKLLDFGLAKLAAEHLGSIGKAVSTQGVLLGTPRYMAPELCLDQGVSDKVDVYSLGVMLYQLAAGEVPFSHSAVLRLIEMHAYQAPRPLQELASEVPTEFATLVHQMLAKDPNRRPTMAQVRGELEQQLAPPSRSAVSPSHVSPASWMALPDRRTFWSGIGLALAALLIVLGLSTLRQRPSVKLAAGVMVHVPAGAMMMGAEGGKPDEQPAHEVRLAAFDIDKTEVTVAAYQACVKAGNCGCTKGPVGEDVLFRTHCPDGNDGTKANVKVCTTLQPPFGMEPERKENRTD